jgi:Fe-S oxidoreductase/nitrate reductase gamma subunit
MQAIPTREILWNISHPLNVVALYLLLGVAVAIGLVGILRRAELWRSGKSAPDYEDNILKRVYALLTGALFQRKVVRERVAAIGHTLIYFGFLVLLFTTTMVFIDHDLGIRIYQGDFYLFITFISDIFGFGLLIGCAVLAHRRYLARPDALHSKPADCSALIVLALLVVQGFLLEGLRIHATNDPWARYSPVGLLVAKFFWGLTPAATSVLHFALWWFHTLTVYAVIALAPYTKFFHIISSSVNLFFSERKRPKGALSFPGNLESLVSSGEEFSIGIHTLKDLSWKQMLDLDACTQCGRCQSACPAYRSGKPLSPKWVILDTRNHALTLQAQGKTSPSKFPSALAELDRSLLRNTFLPSQGILPKSDGSGYELDPAARAENKRVQAACLNLGGSMDDAIGGGVMDPEVFWSCTTCMACVEACPVGINHVEQIIENRRNMVLMRGQVPSEAQKTLRALETRANPYGAPEDRIKWLEGLGFDVPILKPGDRVDYLYWVGCVSAYDQRKQKIARALVTIMQRAGLSYGILGTAENCSGDPARRLGEENLYQSLAKKNIEVLKAVQFSTLVANCPHCFNTIKNEYPQLGNLGSGREPKIIHHSKLLKELIESGKIKVQNESEKAITYHDPCYLGRYNDEYDAPREVIQRSSKLPILEMKESREKGLCCGAGGGHFWMDLKIGERVNVLRTDQAAATGAARVATSCPFCLQMIEDGTKLTNREASMDVRDIAEIIAEGLR